MNYDRNVRTLDASDGGPAQIRVQRDAHHMATLFEVAHERLMSSSPTAAPTDTTVVLMTRAEAVWVHAQLGELLAIPDQSAPKVGE